MEIKKESRTYILTGTTSLLGSNPANPEIHAKFVASKAANLEREAEEEAMLPGSEALAEAVRDIKEQGLTVFLRNNHGELVLGNHAVKGFFKGTLNTLKDQIGITAVKSKVDNLLFISPTFIVIHRDGVPVTEPDGWNERPLRAETMQGPRVALASSEEIDAPWEIAFTVTLFENGGTARSKPLTWEAVEAALDYGEWKGLGQWRNGGKGSFTWRRAD